MIGHEATSLGDAGNVARNIASLGARVTLIGGRGEDAAGNHISELLARSCHRRRPCGAGRRAHHGKIRYIADQQQVMRADHPSARHKVGRSAQDERARAIVLAPLAAADLVVLFAEDTPDNLIRQIRPDLLVKGADYKRENIVGTDFVASYGGEVMRADLVPDRSTSDPIGRARQ